jgi:peptidoglycan/LPS O-acetylase OafA/YrhL
MAQLRDNALDSWRGLCALLVALFHFPVLGLIHDNALVRHSYLFVDFFFVLSGFVIAASQDRRPDAFLPFMLKRFGRIWPLHVAMLGVFVVAALAQGDFNSDERHSAGAIVTNLFMVHAWGVHRDLTWNDPSWSISVEWLLYLIFAVLAFVPGRRFVYAGLVVLGVGALFFFAPNGMGSTFDFGVARGLAGFFVGALIARAPLRDFGGWVELAVCVGVAVFVAAGVAPYVGPFVFGAAVYVFAGSRGFVTTALRSKPMVWIGERSYTLYIIHAAVVAGLWAAGGALGWANVAGRLDAGPFGDLVALPYLAVILALAALAHPGELACQKWFKRRADDLRRKDRLMNWLPKPALVANDMEPPRQRLGGGDYLSDPKPGLWAGFLKAFRRPRRG